MGNAICGSRGRRNEAADHDRLHLCRTPARAPAVGRTCGSPHGAWHGGPPRPPCHALGCGFGVAYVAEVGRWARVAVSVILPLPRTTAKCTTVPGGSASMIFVNCWAVLTLLPST